jgi:hypothetical protein
MPILQHPVSHAIPGEILNLIWIVENDFINVLN